jgi:hypothetical protein
MQLGKRGWLRRVLVEAVAAHRPDEASPSFQQARRFKAGRGSARCYLRGILRESGLLYGTPSAPATATVDTKGPEEVLFLAVLRTFCRIGLDIAVLADGAPGPRAEQLLLLLAAMGRQLDDAEDLHRRIERASKQWPLPEKVWTRVELALEQRALSLAADPYYGIVLHNGAVYSDANLFGRLAIAYFSRNTFPREAAERRVRFASQQKALLVKVLVGLVCAERKPSFPTRRAILRQVDDLHLPDDLADATRQFARTAFERPVSMKQVLKGVRSQDMKRFILEQTLLASIVDGRRSAREVEWTQSLGALLGFSKTQITSVDLTMAEFYAQHRTVVDVFTLKSGAEMVGEEWVDTMSTSVQKNYRRLLKEIRKTGELSVLLGRAARGQKLSSDEKQRMRAQLIDVAKAVPALAIFAAPGGLLLLVALAKVLPFDLLPSAFRDDEHEVDSGEPPTTH